MLRMFGLFIVIMGTSLEGASAQAISVLEIRSESETTVLDVSLGDAVITEGVLQLMPELTGLGLLLDLKQEPAIAVSSQDASANYDLVLISPSGRINMIVRNAAAGSRNPIALSGVTAAVLQLSAGQAKESGFQPGETVAHEILGNQTPEPE